MNALFYKRLLLDEERGGHHVRLALSEDNPNCLLGKNNLLEFKT
jgi:hypothetical protein